MYKPNLKFILGGNPKLYKGTARIALTTNTEDASNDEFSASFGLSSLKGNKPSYVLRTKSHSKIHSFEVYESFKIINFVLIKAKTEAIW